MLTLTPEQLRELTGYTRRAEQLAELHRRGYGRAYRNRLGEVVLTLEHYHAVESRGAEPMRPKVRVKAAA